jgi:vacuolar-type H+-ATPase subunit H
MNFKLNSREAETQELLELEKSLPEDLPEISLLLLQTARNKLKLDEIRKAEENYDKRLQDAKQNAALILQKAKQMANDEKLKRSEEVSSWKSNSIKSGNEEIEESVKKIVQKSREDSAKLGKKVLDGDAVSKIAKEFLNSL